MRANDGVDDGFVQSTTVRIAMEHNDHVNAVAEAVMEVVRTQLARDRVTKLLDVTLVRGTKTIRRHVIVRYKRNPNSSHLATVRRQLIDQLHLPRDGSYAIDILRGGKVFTMPTFDPDLVEDGDSVIVTDTPCGPSQDMSAML